MEAWRRSAVRASMAEASFHLGTSALIPAKHAQRAQGIPPARSALALVRLNRHHAGMHSLEQPSSVGAALGRDELDGLGHTLVRRDAGAAQVVKPAQYVVVPPCREGEALPRTVALPIALDRLARRPPTHEPPREQVFLPTETGLGRLPAACARPFVLEQGFQHADGGVERRPRRTVWCFAVPAAVWQLLSEQAVDDAPDVLAEVGADRGDLPIDARLDLAGKEGIVFTFP